MTGVQTCALPIYAAVAYNRGPNGNSRWSLSKKKLDEQGVHSSEYSWIGTDFDQILDNNGTLDHLYHQVKCLAQDPLHAKEDRS